MGYYLGVDLGTTYTAAAVCRSGSAQITELGNRTATIPSVVLLTEQGDLITGEAANRRAMTEPDRVAREFKRRIGDPTPLLLGGSPHSAESLSARLLEWVVEHVTEREGERPERVAVTHPANWGPYKLDLLHQAVRLADIDEVVTLTEPEAAAIHYSTMERVEPGTTIAVFDLGGGTFDAAILRKTGSGFDFLGQPEGIERLGGIDFDEAVFAFVTKSLGQDYQELDRDDDNIVAAVGRLRREAVEAKEALSGDTSVAIPVMLPSISTTVRLTRSEFEDLIRPSLSDTIGSMRRAIRSASLEPAEIDVVLLVGGSSRIPLVGQLVRAELGRPVAVDAHPKHSIALGAALAAAAEPGAAHLEPVDGAPLVAADSGATPAPVPESERVANQTALMPEVTPPAPEVSSPGPLGSDAPVVGNETVRVPQEAPSFSGNDTTRIDPADLASAAPVVGGGTAPDVPATPAAATVAVPQAFTPAPAEQTSDTSAGSPPASGMAASAGLSSAPSSGGSSDSRTKLWVGLAVAAVVVLLAGVAVAQMLGGGDTEAADGGNSGETTVPDEGQTTAPPEDDGESDQNTTVTTSAEDENTTVTPEKTTTTTEKETTTTPSTEPPFTCAPNTQCAEIADATPDGGELLIEWETNYEASTSGFHGHFYFDIYEPEQVSSTPEGPQAPWVAVAAQPYRTGGAVSLTNIPDGATQVCVVAANGKHQSIDHENANCVDIPAQYLNN